MVRYLILSEDIKKVYTFINYVMDLIFQGASMDYGLLAPEL